MEKALKILNDSYYDDRGILCVENTTALDLYNAIEELEAMKTKTCHWCKQSWEPNNQTFHRYFCNYLRIPVHGNFYCNRYEPKDTQC